MADLSSFIDLASQAGQREADVADEVAQTAELTQEKIDADTQAARDANANLRAEADAQAQREADAASKAGAQIDLDKTLTGLIQEWKDSVEQERTVNKILEEPPKGFFAKAAWEIGYDARVQQLEVIRARNNSAQQNIQELSNIIQQVKSQAVLAAPASLTQAKNQQDFAAKNVEITTMQAGATSNTQETRLRASEARADAARSDVNLELNRRQDARAVAGEARADRAEQRAIEEDKQQKILREEQLAETRASRKIREKQWAEVEKDTALQASAKEDLVKNYGLSEWEANDIIKRDPDVYLQIKVMEEGLTTPEDYEHAPDSKEYQTIKEAQKFVMRRSSARNAISGLIQAIDGAKRGTDAQGKPTINKDVDLNRVFDEGYTVKREVDGKKKEVPVFKMQWTNMRGQQESGSPAQFLRSFQTDAINNPQMPGVKQLTKSPAFDQLRGKPIWKKYSALQESAPGTPVDLNTYISMINPQEGIFSNDVYDLLTRIARVANQQLGTNYLGIPSDKIPVKFQGQLSKPQRSLFGEVSDAGRPIDIRTQNDFDRVLISKKLLAQQQALAQIEQSEDQSAGRFPGIPNKPY